MGTHHVYPVPLTEYWQGCLDVIHQYEVVVDVDLASGRMVFINGSKLPDGEGGGRVG